MTDEPWRKAKLSMPGAMRLVFTSPEANAFHPVLRQESPEHYWPAHPVVAVIGPFDNHMGQGELQARLEAVVRQWNAEVAAAHNAHPAGTETGTQALVTQDVVHVSPVSPLD